MNLPKLPARKPGASGPGSKGVGPPAFLTDLVKDMRDRRLIVPAIALLAAILAVPFVLSSSPEAAVPAPPLPPDPQAAAVEPAVLAVQETGVRDFRERLDELAEKNPFGDRFAPEESSVSGDAEASQLVAPEDEGAKPVETSPVPEEPGSSGAAEPVGSGTTTPPASAPQEEPYMLSSRVDVEVGVMGRDRRQTIENVKGGDVLPSKQIPVAMFLGNDDGASAADFLVSRDVSRVNGDGNCKPGKNNCEFLRLEDGDSAYFRFADGKRYVISVKDIYFERVPQGKADEN